MVLATGGYSNVFYLSTQREGLQRHGHLARPPQGRLLREPLLHPDPPHLHPRCRRAPVEAHADERVAAQRWPHLVALEARTTAPPEQIPESERDYYLERRYPAFANLVPRDVASRAAKKQVDEGPASARCKNGVYLDFAEAIHRLGRGTDRAALRQPLRDVREDHRREPVQRRRCASTRPPHYTMGGLWVDYNLMSNVPGLFVIGEANFSDHGANRLGASALMQGLADGYFVLPATIAGDLAAQLGKPVPDPARARRSRKPKQPSRSG